MQPEAIAALPDFLVRCGEGRARFAYPDELGIITTAIGCALFEQHAFAALEWRNPDGSQSSTDQVQAAYIQLRSAAASVIAHGPKLWPGGSHFACLTTIRLTNEGVDALVTARLMGFDPDLRTGWPGWDDPSLPWQAQVGLARLAWACGTRGNTGCNQGGFPKLHAAWLARDWETCAQESFLRSITTTEPKGNELEREMFMACLTPDPPNA